MKEKLPSTSRRKFITQMTLLGLATGFSIPLFAEQPIQFSKNGKINLEQFMTISRLLTYKTDLDATIGKKIFASLKNKIDWKTLNNHLLKYGPELTSKNLELKKMVVAIIRAWYVGVIFSEKEKPVFITYYDALMYRESIKVRNIPTNCGGEFGFWSEAPIFDKANT